MDLNYCTFDLPAEDRADLRMTIYTAEPGTPSEDALKLLATGHRRRRGHPGGGAVLSREPPAGRQATSVRAPVR